MGKPGLAVCFFGIPRSLRYTAPSILANVIAPARALGSVTTFAHFYAQDRIHNTRSGEMDLTPDNAHDYLPIDRVEISSPRTAEIEHDIAMAQRYGDAWEDGFSSLRNLIHQLHSLHRVSEAAQRTSPDIVIFARPDLNYHDSLAPALHRAVRASRRGRALLLAPGWQRHGGVNDRFAIAAGRRAIEAYGYRLRAVQDYCETSRVPLHSERLASHAAARADVAVTTIPQRASRVRANAVQAWEEFDLRIPTAIRWRIDHQVGRRSRLLQRLLSAVYGPVEQLVWGDRYADLSPPRGVTQAPHPLDGERQAGTACSPGP